MAIISLGNALAAGVSYLTGSGAATSNTPAAIQNIKSTIEQYNVLRSCRGQIEYTVPKLFPTPNTQRLVTHFCEAFDTPSVALQTEKINRWGSGPAIQYPINTSHNDINVTQIVDGHGILAKYYYSWINHIVPNDSRTRVRGHGFRPKYRKNSTKHDYTTDISIRLFAENDKIPLIYKLYNAYPLSMSGIQINQGSTNDLARINVTFTYEYFTIIDPTGTEVESIDRGTDSIGLLGSLVKAATAVQTIATIKKPRSVGDILNVTNNAAIVVGGFSR